MLTAAEIGNIGERFVTAALRDNGWQCYRNTQLPGATDIEATGGGRSLLVQVKTAVYPNLPADLTADELRGIVSRANRTQREAWLARLQINAQGALVGQIAWTKLN